MIGIVLAGGNALRLPNKPLLPLHNGKPAITSGIDFLIKVGIKDIKIVVPPRSPICHILRHHYSRSFQFVTQREPLGVPQAISEVGTLDSALVVYCDNVYEGMTLSDLGTNSHSVKFINDIKISRHLSKYDYNTNRWEQQCASCHCVAGWMFLTMKAMSMVGHFRDTVALLNCIDAEPFQIEAINWWDIGTAETYRTYWEHF